MSALPEFVLDPASMLRFSRMHDSDLDEVMTIELAAFPFPWTRPVFESTLTAGYDCWVARNDMNVLIGYFVLMQVVDEVHLLTIAVHPELHGRGYGRILMNYLISLARGMQMQSMLLEVRPSNLRAVELYRCYGFEQIGRRKNYYAAPDNTREDALVMRMPL
ncbi:MAG: rimI [Burkholderiaceae bacterium]|nr:rimI [Burkholderiaceae bacterium]